MKKREFVAYLANIHGVLAKLREYDENNEAKRQTVAAFREKGVWKIGVQ